MQAGQKCPCCSQPLPVVNKVYTDLDTNTIQYAGQTVDLNPSQTEIAYVLSRAMPNYVSSEKLISAVWGAEPPLGASRTIRVHICQLNSRIKHIGLRADGFRWGGVGYRFVARDVGFRELSDTKKETHAHAN